MPTLEYLGESYTCATAIKGDNYIRLLDEKGCMIASFEEISDFSGFKITNGGYTSPTMDHHCYLAVIRDDGTIGKGGHKCSDIPTTIDDIGAAASNHKHTKSEITDFPTSMPASDVYSWAKASTKPTYTASEVGAVPTSRTVNGKALSSNITLSASDVDAASSSHGHAASEITSGTLSTDRIPDLAASKIASGTLSTDRIPGLAASKITSGTLAVGRGGTGVTANPSMITNLGSTSAASVFAASPRPGVTGTLPVGNGGTGKTSWTANRLVYPSASTTMAQLPFPTVAGSVLRQGTSGEPYWTSLTDLATAMGALKIQTGTYTGTGTYASLGSDATAESTSITFNFEPTIVFVSPKSGGSRGGFAWIRGMSAGSVRRQTSESVTLTWSGNSLSFYSSTSAEAQLNKASTTYQYVAIG